MISYRDHTNVYSNPNFSFIISTFDSLLHVVGKPLPSNIYALITYIESNILEDKSKKKSNPQAEKAKVLRETKLIPKIILCIENFNKHVILLSKKTNDRLANLLHFGTVRDFRIKTSDLKAAIDRTLSHSSQIQSTESGGEDNVEEEDNPTYDVEDNDETILRELEDDIRESQIATNRETIDNNQANVEEEGESERSSCSRSSTPSVDAENTFKKPQKKSQPKAQKKTEEKSKKAEEKQNKAEDKQKKRGEVKQKKSEEKGKPTKAKKGSISEEKPSTSKRGKAAEKEKLKVIEIDGDEEPVNGDTTFITGDDDETLDHESNRESCTQLMKNLAKVNAKAAKKRSLRDSEQQEDPDVLCAPPLEPLAKKSRRGRKPIK